jgi:dTDP-L-rhamnose 4-epimerase
MRAARRADLLALALEDRRFGYPLEMVVRAAEAGWRIQETAVPYHPRTGKSKVTGTVRGTARAVRDMRRVLASISPAPAANTAANTAASTAANTAVRTAATAKPAANRVPVTSQAAS